MAIDSVEPETDVNPNAIVFISPGSEPDVRFRVFDDEYHLHSTVLKYHSRFFRQFLDSPDKPAGPASKSFCYEYVSFFDKDGSDWSLQPASKVWVSILLALNHGNKAHGSRHYNDQMPLPDLTSLLSRKLSGNIYVPYIPALT